MRWICVVILFIQGCNAVAPVRPIESKDDKKQVDIKVDTQMILWALLKPVLKLKADAFKEI